MDNPQDKLLDFRVFLWAIWKHLTLPTPSENQYDMASFLNDDSIKRQCIQAFRGIGKSWITDAFCAYSLYKNKDERILLVSASSQKAEQSLRFIKSLLTTVPFLQHLAPSDSNRNTAKFFDVNGSSPAEAPSIRAAGITGQITGSRASLIVADDIEIPKNSLTTAQRERLAESVKEFDAIIVPQGRIVYLGTPQTEQSLYNILPDRGYTIRIWPARYPTKQEATASYGDRLSPVILAKVKDHAGAPTEPDRFSDEELFIRERSYGRSGFKLQFMLDTRLSDQERYPLKLSDFIVIDTDIDIAPQKAIYGSRLDLELKELPNIGLTGDKLYQAAFLSSVDDWIPYTGSVLAIDPSGRGKDETAYAVAKFLNGYIFILDCGGMLGGYTEQNLQALANIAKKYKVKKCLIESNFGDGMFKQLLDPYLINTHPVSTEEIRSTTQKEARIIDTLEPPLNQHRLILDKSLISRDFYSTSAYDCDDSIAHQYQLLYQLTRITKDRGSLLHDDRIDALAMAVGHFTSSIRIEADKAILAHRNKLYERSLHDFCRLHDRTFSPPAKPSFTTKLHYSPKKISR